MSARRTAAAVLTALLLLVAAVAAVPVAAAELTVLNPSATVRVSHQLAPRLTTLNGKTIAMWLSGLEVAVGRGDVAYEALAATLKTLYPEVNIIPYTELPIKYSPQDEVLNAILAKKPDGVIIGFGG